MEKSASSWSGPGGSVERGHAGGYRGSDHHGQAGADEFERRLKRLLNREPLGADIEEVLQSGIPGGYKDRPVDCRLLHYSLWRDAQGDKVLSLFNNDKPAALPSEGSCVQRVLDARADPNGMMYNLAFKHKQEIPPIVFSASLGHVPGMLQLLERRVDVNLHAVMDGSPHYCAIHDAVFLEKEEAVRALLEAEADINLKNKDGLTPLHLAAWVGAADIAEDLVNSNQFHPQDLHTKARVRRETEVIEHLNPLELATFQTWYPPEKLTLLMPFTYGRGSFFEVIREMIREEKRSAVSRLLDGIERAAQDANSELKHKIKMEALKRRGQYSKLCRKKGHSLVGFTAEVITRAPKVAAQILDLLTSKPYVKRTNVTRHPLPVTSNLCSRDHIGRLLGHKDPMITAYECDYMDQDLAYQGMLSTYAKECKYKPLGLPEWKFDTRNNLVPDWHKRFAPMERHHHSACQVMVLMLPSILDVRVVHALNIVDEVNVWALPACQCMNYHLWAMVVHRAFYVRVTLEFLLAVTLTVRAILRDGDVRLNPEDRYDNLHDPFWSFCMCIILGTGFREVFLLCHRFYAHTRYYRLPRRDFFTMRSDVILTAPQWAVEAVLFVMLLLYAYFAMTELDESRSVTSPPEAALEDATDLNIDSLDALHPHLKRTFAGSFNLLFLVINVGFRWMHVMVLLRGASGVGEKFLAVIHSFNPMTEIFAILGFGIMALVGATLAFRGHAPWKKVVWWVTMGVFCGDGAALNNIMKLDLDLFKGWVSVCVVLCLLLLMTLTLMNLIIGVFGNAYTECEDLKRLYFLRSRNLICEQFLLEPVWPRPMPTTSAVGVDQGSTDSDDADSDTFSLRSRGLLFGIRSGRRRLCRCRVPEAILQRKWTFCTGLFVVWMVSEAFLPNRRWLCVCQGLLLAALEIAVQAACMQNDAMDDDIVHNGLESQETKDDDTLEGSDEEDSDNEDSDDDSEPKGVKERCLWMCVRADFDKDFYQHDAAEQRDSVADMKGTLQDVSSRLDALMAQVEELTNKAK